MAMLNNHDRQAVMLWCMTAIGTVCFGITYIALLLAITLQYVIHQNNTILSSSIANNNKTAIKTQNTLYFHCILVRKMPSPIDHHLTDLDIAGVGRETSHLSSDIDMLGQQLKKKLFL